MRPSRCSAARADSARSSTARHSGAGIPRANEIVATRSPYRPAVAPPATTAPTREGGRVDDSSHSCHLGLAKRAKGREFARPQLIRELEGFGDGSRHEGLGLGWSRLGEWVAVVETLPDAPRLAGFLAGERARWEDDHIRAHAQALLELAPHVARDRIDSPGPTSSHRISRFASAVRRSSTIAYCPPSAECARTTSSISLGNTLTPRTISMSSTRPEKRAIRRCVRPHGHGPSMKRVMSPVR